MDRISGLGGNPASFTSGKRPDIKYSITGRARYPVAEISIYNINHSETVW